MTFSFKKDSWHYLNPGRVTGTKEVITEPEETDNHIDGSTPVEDQLASDVNQQYE